jgi:hypothetical protein
MNPEDEIQNEAAADTEQVEVGDEPSEMIENEDGSTTIVLDEASAETIDPEFYDNLAEDLIDEPDLAAIASDLMERVEADIEARKPRDESYADALKRTGLDGTPTAGADFEGASTVVVPLVTEACVDFAARAIKELFPLGGADGGPAKMHIVGKPTVEKVERARRKAKFMNWQLTQQMSWFRQEMEQALTQVPMAGASYIKFSWNRDRQRPDTMFVPLDDIILPAAASSFATADRKTHRQTITKAEFDRRVESGMYRDIGDTILGEPESSEAHDASDDIEGVERDSENLDQSRTIYEVACALEIEADTRAEKTPAPYLVTIDEPTGKILAIYRNWSEDDPDQEPLEHIVELPFIPWRGAYPLNLPQMVGGLSTAATGALRALLDAAHASNMPGGFYLKGSSASKGGQNISMRPGEYHPIEGAVGVTDDIRKMLMPAPVNPPSPVLYELLGFLITQGKGVVQTTMELADQSPNQPVGTTLALIEQGMTVFSAIHARLHAAMGRALTILARLNKVYLRDEMQVRELGELIVKRADFDGPNDIVPVSDPNIFSETQRMAQVQMVAQRAAAMPQLYDLRKVELMILERSKIPEAESLLIPMPEPQRLNGVNENVAAAMGKPLVAFPDQNHLAHLRIHLEFLTHPMFGQSQLLAPGVIPQMLTHLKDHVVYWYVSTLVEMGEEVTGVDMSKLMDEDEAVEREYENLLADLSTRTLAMSDMALGPFQIPEVVAQSIQIMQQLQQMAQGGQQMTDPGAAMMADVERKAAADQMKAQTDAQKAQIDQMRAQIDAQKLALQQAELTLKETEMQMKYGIEGQRAQQQAALKQEEMTRQDTRIAGQIASQVKMNESDNAIALQIARERIMAGRAPGLTNGTGINPIPR